MFDATFKANRSNELYGPHGVRSGLGIFLLCAGYSEMELTRYFYWQSVSSLQRYTYGIELSECKNIFKKHAISNGFDFKNSSIRETISTILLHDSHFCQFFEKLRTVNILKKSDLVSL